MRLIIAARLLLLMIGGSTIASPIAGHQADAFGQNNGQPADTSSNVGIADTKIPEFAVVSVHANQFRDRIWRSGFTLQGYSAKGVTIRQLVQQCYGIYEDDRILGIPKWVEDEHYDIEAKVDDADLDRLRALDLPQRRPMLRALMSDRFGLKAHSETVNQRVYALVIAKGGIKFHDTPPDRVPKRSIKGVGGTLRRFKRGQLTIEWETTNRFADALSRLGVVDRPVVDMTNLSGHYDFTLDWAPYVPNPSMAAGSSEMSEPVQPMGPSIFTAMREQLGLELKPQKGPVEVIMIDHVDRPSGN